MTEGYITNTMTATRDIFNERCSGWAFAPWHDKEQADQWTPPKYGIITVGYFTEASRSGKFADAVADVRKMMDCAIEAQRLADTETDPQRVELLTASRDNYLRAYKLGKLRVPCAMLSGTNESRGADTFDTLSKILCIDIDAPKPGEPDNGNGWVTDWGKVKKDMGALPWVSYAGLSIGGRGVFMLIPIARDDAMSYAEYYTAWALLLQKHFNLATDPACKNRNRLRYMTHDATPYINHAALVWDKVLKVAQDWRQGPQFDKPCELDEEQQQTVRDAVAYCVKNGVNMAETYDDWLRLAAFFAHCWDDAEGNALFHDLAALSSKYRTGENDRKLSNLRKQHPNPVKFGSFVKMCKDNGVPIKGSVTTNSTNIAPFPCAAQPQPPIQAPPPPGPTPQPAQLRPYNGPAPFPDVAAVIAKQPPLPPCPLENMQSWHEAQPRREAQEPPQEDAKTDERPPAPLPPDEPPQGPQMSESEAYMLTQAAGFIAEGQQMLDMMREQNPAFDTLCNDLDLHYCGHTDQDGRGWIMTDAQFNAFYNSGISGNVPK